MCTSSTPPSGGDGSPNQTNSMTGMQFAECVTEKNDIDWTGYQIIGTVNLKGATFATPIEILNVVFTSEVNLSECRFERGLNLTGCSFEDKLILADARIEGPLRLDDVIIRAKVEPPPDLELIRKIIAKLKEGRRQCRTARTLPRDERLRKCKIRSRRRTSQFRWERRLKQAEIEQATPRIVAVFTNVRVAGCLSLMNAKVFGTLSCTHADIEDDFRFDEAHVYGDVRLRRANLGELCTDGKTRITTLEAVDECCVDGTLDLASAKIAGDVRLIALNLGGRLVLQTTRIEGNLICRANERARSQLGNGAWLFGAHVQGTVDFGGTQLSGAFYLARVEIGGNLTCDRTRKWSFVVSGDANLNGAQVGGDVFFIGATLGGDLSFQNASVGGNLYCNATQERGRNYACKIAKRLWLLGAKVTGDVDIDGTHIGAGLVMQNASIGQNVLMKRRGGFPTQITGDAFLNGIQVQGSVELLGVEIQGTLQVNGALIASDLIVAFDLGETGQIVRSNINRTIEGNSAVIGKRLILFGLTVGWTPPSSPVLGDTTVAVSFVGAQINGECLMYAELLVKEILESRSAGSLVHLTSAQQETAQQQASKEWTIVQGDLQLSRAQMHGNLVLDGIKVSGELDLRDAKASANIICRPREIDSQTVVRASVQRMNLESLETGGDMVLTGLEVDSDMNLQNARIQGRLELYPNEWLELPSDQTHSTNGRVDQEAKQKRKDRVTAIGGLLRLDAAEIGDLILSGESFDQPLLSKGLWERAKETLKGLWAALRARQFALFGRRDQSSEKIFVKLERAVIGRLKIAYPLPGRLDLSDLKVGSWEERGDFFADMLVRSWPFRKSNYIAIETDLRNKGKNEEADRIHVQMRRRDRQTSSLWKKLVDVFFDISTKYGTTSVRLFVFMIFSFILSVAWFSNSNHVEYEINPTSQRPKPPVIHPLDWSIEDAMFLAIQLHVPIISLGIDEHIGPSGTCSKAIAMLIVAMSWVIWPLFVASASGFLRKRS